MGGVQTYKGKRYDWERGRLVKVRQGNKNAAEGAYEECTFTYDGYGRRTQKSYLTGYNYPAEDAAYNSSTTNTIDYTYDNSGRLIRELRTNVIQYGTTTTTTRELIYLYDESGMIGVMHSHNGETPQSYYYHRNLQGDVIAIYDANGEKQVEYAYDAWGNCEIVYGENSNLASLNPIRYRGYYYDTETSLFWLSSRYYSPELCRFISQDDVSYLDPTSINGLNLYAYCMNNPIMYADPSGHWIETVFDILSLSASIVEVVINPLDVWAWAGLAGDALDLIPFVTGVGEGIKGYRVVAKAADLSDDALDAIRLGDRAKLAEYGLDMITFSRATDLTADALSSIN